MTDPLLTAAAKVAGTRIGAAEVVSGIVGSMSTLMAFLQSNHGGMFFAYLGLAIVSFLLVSCRRDHSKQAEQIKNLSVKVAELSTALRYEKE